MFNRQPFNRPAVESTAVLGIASIKANASAILYKDISHYGYAHLIMRDNLDITKNYYVTGSGANKLNGILQITKNLLATSDPAEMEMLGEANQVISGESIIVLEGVALAPGDELIIDTEKMTVTINGINGMKHFSVDSEFFTLLNGDNVVIYSDNQTVRDVNIDIIWKDRWL